MRALVLCVAVALSSSAALAQKNPDLEKAQLLLAGKKYDQALKAIEAAAKKGGLDRESLLTLLESRGLAEASLGKLDRAEESFRSVLQLDGKRDLTGKYTGKAAQAIAAAKDWFKANGGIELGPLEPGAEDGRVKQVSLFIKNDPLKLIALVRIYTRVDGGAWKPTEAKVINGAAALDVDAVSIEWWAEALSEKKDQLMFLASAGRPIKQSAPAPAPVAAKVVDEPKKEEPATLAPVAKAEPAPVEVKSEPTSSGSALRPAGYVLVGLGVAAAGVGAYFGITSSSTRETVKADLAKGGYDPVELYQRDQGAIMRATVANVLFVSAGALGLTGGLLWFLGRDVTVTPTVGGSGGGVTLLGHF
ncbi:MAG: hypothetical protein U0228_39435 [Myxococcaceae bacterium]